MKFFLAVLSFVVISFALAFPWHMIWFHDQYVAWGAFTRKEPIMVLGLFAMITQGIVIAYLFPKLQGDRHPVVEGVFYSLVLGLLVYTVMGPATAAKFQIEPVASFLATHTIFQILQFTLTGVALGLIYGKRT